MFKQSRYFKFLSLYSNVYFVNFTKKEEHLYRNKFEVKLFLSQPNRLLTNKLTAHIKVYINIHELINFRI